MQNDSAVSQLAKKAILLSTIVLTCFTLALMAAPADRAYAESGDLAMGAIADSSDPEAMYRLYNPNTGEHFYTASQEERGSVIRAGWTYEGVGWANPASGTNVYRLYNKNGSEHHYTTSASERDALKAAGWIYEGVGWKSDKLLGIPVYREYNPNQFSCNHNYTTSLIEHRALVKLGWVDEGIAWHGSAALIERTNPAFANGAKNATSLTGVVIRKNETTRDTGMAWGCASYFLVLPEPVLVTYDDATNSRTTTRSLSEIHICSEEHYTVSLDPREVYLADHPWEATPNFNRYLGHEVTITGKLFNTGNAHCRGWCRFNDYSISVIE